MFHAWCEDYCNYKFIVKWSKSHVRTCFIAKEQVVTSVRGPKFRSFTHLTHFLTPLYHASFHLDLKISCFHAYFSYGTLSRNYFTHCLTTSRDFCWSFTWLIKHTCFIHHKDRAWYNVEVVSTEIKYIVYIIFIKNS